MDEEEEGSRHGSLVEEDPATENWTEEKERTKGCQDSPGWPTMSTEARGWRPWLPVASSTVTSRQCRCGCAQRTTLVYLLWFAFMCQETLGSPST